MDRLTDKDTGILISNISRAGKNMDCKEETGIYSKELLEEAIDKLATYEDIGTPQEFAELKAENERLTKQLDNKCDLCIDRHKKQLETRTFPLELQYGDLTNYIGYGQSETEKLVAISFGVLKEKGEYFGENKPNDESKVLFVAYFDRTESLEVLENIVNIGKARLKELQKED